MVSQKHTLTDLRIQSHLVTKNNIKERRYMKLKEMKGQFLEMDNIFVIDTATRCNLGNISFIPHKDDRISMKASDGKEIELVVNCVLYAPWEHATLIFVNIVEPYYTAMVKEIKWS